MFTRDYHRPLYGVHGTDDVLAYIDREYAHQMARGRFSMAIPFRALGLSAMEYYAIQSHWEREQHLPTTAIVVRGGVATVLLPIPKVQTIQVGNEVVAIAR